MSRDKEDWVKPIGIDVTKKRELKIDWSFISSLEGFEVRGYIPKEEDANSNRVKSGVTIASGFDLGQHSQKYLYDLNLPNKLVTKLHPYMGKTGKHAKQFLEDLPLILTKEEALLVNKKVKHDKALEAAALFDRDSKLRFDLLDGPIQTVIMSVAFQYGDLSKRTPNFWKTATTGDWERMVWHLRHFGDMYHRRRLKESNVVENYLTLKKKGTV